MNPPRRRTYQFGSLEPVLLKRESRIVGHPVYAWKFRYSAVVDGKRKRLKVCVGTTEQYPTEDDALVAAEPWRLAANAHTGRWQISMRGAVERYINDILRPCLVPVGGTEDEAARMGHDNAYNQMRRLQTWVIPRWGDVHDVREFEKPQKRYEVEEWLRSLLRGSKNPKGLEAKTLGHIHEAMSHVFKFCTKWGYLESNPMSGKRVELPRGRSKRSKKFVQLSPAQYVNTLLPELELRERAATMFDGWLGLRVSEEFGSRWRHLDLELGIADFQHGFVKGRFTHLKTEASRTQLPIPEEVVEVLREWKKATPYNGPDDFVFASPFKKGEAPLWPHTMFRAKIAPVITRLGLPPITWHSLRHSLTAWAKEAGLRLTDVKALTRHQNVQTTADIYGEVQMPRKREAQDEVVKYVKRTAEKHGAKKKGQQ